MTTTFLFTDIAGSSGLWEENPEAMRDALAAHDGMIVEAVERLGGRVFKHTGDGMAAAFDSARAALDASIEIQRGLASIEHPAVGRLTVRIGVHSGEAHERDGDFFGLAVTRAARLMGAGHGGQVLVSRVSERLAAAEDLTLRDLGEHRLRGLTRPERIFQLTVDGLPADFPPLRTVRAPAQDPLEEQTLSRGALSAPASTRHNLPAERSSLVGRDAEIDEVLARLEKTRLLTLTGSGGVGKTRLAQAVSHRLLDRYPDGVWFIDLAPLEDGDLVMKRVAAVLEVEPPVLRPVADAVVDAIADSRMLFILDNCEHLIDAGARAAHQLLHAPNTTVLATSRETLRIDGETAWRVPSLPTPRLDTPAEQTVRMESVRLFSQRASEADPSFRLDTHNIQPVANLCRRLDGIPLAIELAAARTTSLTPAQLEQRLDHRFDILTAGSRAALPRHRTLEGAIQWSYDLLTPAEQQMFNELSVFAGSFDLASAVALTSTEERAAVDLLDSLLTKSLLIPDRHGHTHRFRLLETLRQYGRGKLAAEDRLDAARDSLLDWAVGRTADLGPKLMSPDQVMATRTLEMDINSVRSAMRWALESGRIESGLLVAAAISRYWYLQALSSEGAEWYDQFLPRADEVDRPTRLRGLTASSATLVRVGRWEEAFAQAGDALGLLTESDPPAVHGWAVYQYGVASFGLIDIEETREAFVRAQGHFQEAGSAIGLGLAVLLENGAWLLIDAEESLRRSIALTKQMEAANVPIGIAHSTELVGISALKTGRYDLAIERYRQALPIYDEIRVYACQAHCLDGVAVWLFYRDDLDDAAVVAAGVQELRRSLSTIRAPYENFFPELDEFGNRIDTTHPEAASRGRSMTRTELVDFATAALNRS